MADVNGPRRYDASGRREKAAATRRAVIDAARELLEDKGFTATTVAAVAERAGLSPETVYKQFGTKAALTKAVFDVAIGGDDEPTPVAERAAAQAVLGAPDVGMKIRAYASDAALRQERSARIQLAIRDARHIPLVGRLWQTILGERLTGMTIFGRHLVGTGELRGGLALDEVRDILWTYTAVEQYDLLVLSRGWSVERYGEWLGNGLVSALT